MEVEQLKENSEEIDACSREKVWITKGFSAFRKGIFGNAGQNLYVSRNGLLQRIHQYDINRNGCFDLVFCNSQAHWERVPTYVFSDPLSDSVRTELIAEGAISGVVADLNMDGYEDLVIGNGKTNGVTTAGLNAIVYFGSFEGLSERFQAKLPAPSCSAIAVGDFNGDQKPDLAFLLLDGLRLFYQNELGFEMKRFTDLKIYGETMDAYDLDRDGYEDLIVRNEDGSIKIYWGSENGIDSESFTALDLEKCKVEKVPEVSELPEFVADAPILVRVVDCPFPHIFAPTLEAVQLVPVISYRKFGKPLRLDCPDAISAVTGDINGDGFIDLVIACRQPDGKKTELSWIYWGGKEGFSDSHRTPIQSYRACDVAVGDLDLDGYDDIVLCQNRTEDSFTHESLIFRGTPREIFDEPIRVETHDARRVFITKSSDEKKPHLIFINHFSGACKDTVKASVYYGSQDGYSSDRREDLIASGAVEAICTDLDDDGWIDIVLVNASEYSRNSEDPGSFVLLNRKNGFPVKPDVILPTVHAHGGSCADLNRDGYLDLVIGSGCFNSKNPEIVIFYGKEKGFDVENAIHIRTERNGIVYSEARWLYLADLNNDGWLDLIVPQIKSDRSFILWGDEEGFSMDRLQLLSVYHASCARVADLTGNGYLDLIVGGHRQSLEGPADSFVYIYWNGPEGLREDRKMLLPANAVNSMAIADFNGDGTLDLFVACYASPRERDVHSFIYWNRKGKGFSAEDRTRLFTHSASGCIACDFNLDGRVDLAVANHKVEGNHYGWSAVFWNGHDGLDGNRVTRLPTSGPHGMTSIGPGNIADRCPEEYYISTPFKIPEGSMVTKIYWKADIPEKTWVKGQLRFADTEENLDNAPWIGSKNDNSWFVNCEMIPSREKSGEWIQYRLALGATNSLNTPRVKEVGISYNNNNLEKEELGF
jgi:hypothetical protein